MTETRYDIGFIGGGNMAEALFGGMIRAGQAVGSILVSEPGEARREALAAAHGIAVTSDNRDVASRCDTIVLAVKPQVMADALSSMADALRDRKPLLVSIAAGVTLDTLDRLSGSGCPIVRAMPNTPALVGRGATALVANDAVNEAQHRQAEDILGTVGITTWLSEESLIDVVTALSGSGPAYFFLVMDSLCAAAERRGLDGDTARALCTQTALGAATLARDSDQTLERLRLNVTSPGGTTEQGVNALTAAGIEQAFDDAIEAARRRSVELSQAS